MKRTPEQLANDVTDLLNTFGEREQVEKFIEAMNCQHRTLQQAFTRMCVEWLKNCAKDDYRRDGRNEASHTVSKELLKGKESFLPLI